MSTECSGVRLALQPLGRRPVVARFDAAPITSDGGAVLPREVDGRIDLLGRMAGCFVDHRDPGRIHHSVSELISQRVLGSGLGYEDLNDHDRRRRCWPRAAAHTANARKRRGRGAANPTSAIHRLRRRFSSGAGVVTPC
jgi:hypothetical protein